jgi:hypothetical protein
MTSQVEGKEVVVVIVNAVDNLARNKITKESQDGERNN